MSGPPWAVPAHWDWCKIGDLAEVVRGASPRPKGDPRYFGGEIPWISIRDVTAEPGKYLSRTREGVTPAGAERSRLLENGTLILSNSGTVCVPKILAIDGCIHDGFVAFPSVAEEISKQFLYYFFEYIRPRVIAANRRGITQVNLNTTIVRELDVPVAPLAEQHRIVAKIEELFSELDAGVAALERAQAKLERYRASVLKAAVEGKLTERWRAENPAEETGEELLERILVERRMRWEEEQLAKFAAKGKKPPKNWKEKYKEPVGPDTSGLPELPGGWCWAALDQLTCRITSGSRDWKPYYGSGSGVFILAQNVRPGSLDLSERQAVDPPLDDPSRARSLVEEGDLLVTIVGANTGDVCRVPWPLDEHYVCQSVALIRPVSTVTSRFVESVLRSPFGRAVFGQFMYGEGRPHLSFEQLKSTPIPLASTVEQSEIARVDDGMNELLREAEAAVDGQIPMAAALRQSILKRAFEGHLLPQDPNHEPASVLLERIRAEREAEKPKKKRPTKQKATQANVDL